MNPRLSLKGNFQGWYSPALMLALGLATTQSACALDMNFSNTVLNATAEPMQTGKFEPTWESLKQYLCPDWFRDAKFGIWAHWTAQCVPEQGDWYARKMYIEGDKDYTYHLEHYGHPSKIGFKDIDYIWRAEKWDPDKLMQLYKRAGAQYFFALANHHDNFDCFDSQYQPWNSVKIGPKKDIVGIWAQTARKYGLRFGVSVHAAHAWSWFEPAQGADKTGPWAGIPYDGKLTRADGKGQRWDGLDPQDLYAQDHTPGQKLQWEWNAARGSSIPDQAYIEKFYNRTVDLINKYHPDQLYFDDTVLPLYPISDVGLRIAAHFYNSNMREHAGSLEAVLNGKVLNEEQRQCMVWDIERGQSRQIEPFPWQTDTCIGSWHYDRSLFERHKYKSVRTVVQMLADIVSKNGNLMLNIPVRGDGTIDDDELAFLQGLATWMDINREAIFGTRPWKVFGEGPASAGAELTAQGFNEGKGKPFTAEDVRFTSKGDTLYAILLGWPDGPVNLKALGRNAKLVETRVRQVALLGSKEKLRWSLTDEALVIQKPKLKPCDEAVVFKLSFQGK
jgi:alpha-L-fucosidase